MVFMVVFVVVFMVVVAELSGAVCIRPCESLFPSAPAPPPFFCCAVCSLPDTLLARAAEKSKELEAAVQARRYGSFVMLSMLPDDSVEGGSPGGGTHLLLCIPHFVLAGGRGQAQVSSMAQFGRQLAETTDAASAVNLLSAVQHYSS